MKELHKKYAYNWKNTLVENAIHDYLLSTSIHGLGTHANGGQIA